MDLGKVGRSVSESIHVGTVQYYIINDPRHFIFKIIRNLNYLLLRTVSNCASYDNEGR